MQKSFKIISLIIYILLVIALLFAIANSKDSRENKSIGLWYVYSGSMEPTIKINDGFIVAKSNEYNIGDIITFKPKFLEQPYVTHRIIGISDDGSFITKGDNNPLSDQQGGEPAVIENQVIGKLVSINNNPIIIPKLGIISEIVTNKASKLNVFVIISIAIIVFIVGYVVDTLFNKKVSAKRKARIRLLDLAPFFDPVFLIILILFIFNVFMFGQVVKSWGNDKISYVVVSTEGLSSPMPGEKFIKMNSLQNSIPIPFIVILEPEDKNIVINPKKIYVDSKQQSEYTIEITAPDKIGYYTQNIYNKAYPNVLSEDLFDYLYSINQFLPLILIFTPSTGLIIILYIFWIRRWELKRRVIMDWLIPFRAILRRYM